MHGQLERYGRLGRVQELRRPTSLLRLGLLVATARAWTPRRSGQRASECVEDTMDRQHPTPSREPSIGSAIDRVLPTRGRDDAPRPRVHGPLATAEAIANEPAPFPSKTKAASCETFFLDWRRRLTRNPSRRSDGRWEPLTFTHTNETTADERFRSREQHMKSSKPESSRQSPRAL